MEKEATKTKNTFQKGKRSISNSLITFDLPTLIKKLKHKRSWVRGELNAMVLLKSPQKKIVLTALHEDTEIIFFQSNDSITFQIIEGKLMFHTLKESVTLDKGQLLTFQESINYSLKTNEETVFLLTIASGEHTDFNRKF